MKKMKKKMGGAERKIKEEKKGGKERKEKKEKVVCIICKKEKVGIPIKEDVIIRTIRRIKEALRISTGNRLVVCSEDIEEAKKRREKFEKSILTYGGIGAIIGIVLILLTIFSGKSLIVILQTFVLLIFLIIVMAALSLYQYFPAIEGIDLKSKGKISSSSTSSTSKKE